MIIGIGTLSIILGAWDLGIGEISSGGDYKDGVYTEMMPDSFTSMISH